MLFFHPFDPRDSRMIILVATERLCDITTILQYGSERTQSQSLAADGLFVADEYEDSVGRSTL